MTTQKPFRGMQINRTHPLAKGLASCYIINEATGNKIFDLSGNSNDGINSGATWEADGLYFDADNVDLGHIDRLDNVSGMSIVTSLYVTADRDHWIFGRGTSASSADCVMLWADVDCSLGVQGSGNTDTFAFNVGDTSAAGNRVNGTSGLRTLNTKHTLACIINGTYRGLYHNGVLNAEHNSGAQTTIPSNLNEFYLGEWEVSASNLFAGGIQHFYIYNRALSPEEVAWLNREPYAMFEQPISPASWYTILANLATNLFDGKIRIKNSNTNVVDGKIKVKDINTDLFDGKIILSNISSNLVDGKIIIKDSVSNLLDGLLKIKNNTINLFDGKIVLSNNITNLLDGKVIISGISNTATNLFNGLVNILRRHKLTTSSEKEHIMTTSEEDQHILTTSHEYQHNLRSDYD